MSSPRVPSEVGSTRGPSPCGRLSRPPTTMPPLTSCPPSRPPRCYPCRSILPSLEERSGSPTFTGYLGLHATLSDPGGVLCLCPVARQKMVPSKNTNFSASSHAFINGAPSLQPEGLRPTTSLSTLDPCRYRHVPKTRYGVCWVGTFPVALAATSYPAPRGAQCL
jgi:hypothetical protein